MGMFIIDALGVLLIALGLGQIASTWGGWRGLSLVGGSRWAGYGLGGLLLLSGALLLPNDWRVLGWALPMGLLAFSLLAIGGNLNPPPDPHRLFRPDHPGHAHCHEVQIPDGETAIPGLLLRPAGLAGQMGPAICIVPGAGDTKISFKWRLVEALLAAGLTVLTIDPPGHGDYRPRPLAYPDCLSVVPAALRFLKAQPGVAEVGLIGISLGGALAMRSLAEQPTAERLLSALVVMGAPTHIHYNNRLFYREMWNTLYGAPSLSLLQEMSVRQARQTWYSGGYRSRHTTAELFELFNPLESIGKLGDIPILFVYSRRDLVARPEMAAAMRQAAPWANLIETKKASHVMLTLMPALNRQVARWLRAQLSNESNRQA